MADIKLLSGATATATGATARWLWGRTHRVYQATVTGTGAVSATVEIEVSCDGSNWIVAGTITLTGTTSDTDGFASDAPWPYVRADLTAISGTGATVDVYAAGGPP